MLSHIYSEKNRCDFFNKFSYEKNNSANPTS